MRRYVACLLALLILCGLTAPLRAEEGDDFVVEENEENLPPDYRRQARMLMRLMTDEEKVYQLFFVSPEDLTGESRTGRWPEENVLLRYPVGGVVLYGQNIESEDQLIRLTQDIQAQADAARIHPPFLAVHEAGGSVSRVANKLGYPLAPSPEEIGRQGSEDLARQAGRQIADCLTPLGINMTFAPPLDIKTEENELMDQSYGDDAKTVSRLACAMGQALREAGVIPCYGAFPGQGSVGRRNASGEASLRRTLDALRVIDWVPYRAAIAQDAEMIMVSHVLMRAVGDDMPASTSSRVINGLLRGELGYDGVVITESLRMSAVTGSYKTGRECVAALKAGADMLLLPKNFTAAAQAVFQALATGELTMDRVEQSVERILALKIRYGLIR